MLVFFLKKENKKKITRHLGAVCDDETSPFSINFFSSVSSSAAPNSFSSYNIRVCSSFFFLSSCSSSRPFPLTISPKNELRRSFIFVFFKNFPTISFFLISAASLLFSKNLDDVNLLRISISQLCETLFIALVMCNAE